MLRRHRADRAPPGVYVEGRAPRRGGVGGCGQVEPLECNKCNKCFCCKRAPGRGGECKCWLAIGFGQRVGANLAVARVHVLHERAQSSSPERNAPRDPAGEVGICVWSNGR